MSKCVTVRTIPHTTDEQEFVKGIITETTGQSLASAVIKIGYTEYQGGYPATWIDPDFTSTPAVNQRVVGLLVTQTVPVGEYMLWAKIQDSPELIVRPIGRFNVV